jgi:hypothetical protein
VERHLPKLFDNVARFDFQGEAARQSYEDRDTDTIHGVYSSEGEKILLSKALNRKGGVESWLKQLMKSIKQTVITNIRNASKDLAKSLATPRGDSSRETPRQSWVLRHSG